MGSKIYLMLRALLLLVGMFALQGCFEEEYYGRGGGYAPAYGNSYGSPPAYGYNYESPWHEHEEEEREEHGEGERD